MNPKLKPPGIERLKLKYCKLLSTSAFKFNLRRYSVDISPRSLDNPLGHHSNPNTPPGSQSRQSSPFNDWD